MDKKRSNLIQSLQRAVEILDCFTEDSPSLTLPQISDKTGLNINTTRGLVNTLVHYNLISHEMKTNTYSLGLYFVLKSNLVYETHKLSNFGEIARPHMSRITEKYNIFSSLQVVNQNQIFMIETMQPRQPHYRIMASLYEPLEYSCTSSGKLYLQYLKPAELEAVIADTAFTQHTPATIASKEQLLEALREQEYRVYSTEFDELAIGISSIAAPILLPGERLFGTLSVTAPTQILKDSKDAIAADLLEAAKSIAGEVAVSHYLLG